jgi:hypothetical protein
MSKVLTRTWLQRHDVLTTWIGCFLGGWLGLALGYLTAIVIASSGEATGLESLSEGLLIGALTLTLGGLGGSAAGVALSLKVLGEPPRCYRRHGRSFSSDHGPRCGGRWVVVGAFSQ